jgi:hypothetical protein
MTQIQQAIEVIAALADLQVLIVDAAGNVDIQIIAGVGWVALGVKLNVEAIGKLKGKNVE